MFSHAVNAMKAEEVFALGKESFKQKEYAKAADLFSRAVEKK